MQPQFHDQDAAVAFIAVILSVIAGFVIIGIVIQVVVCLMVASCLKRLPTQFRKQEPGMVWLLLIPFFRFIWNFFVHPKVADSYKAYFDAIGRTDVGDCGKGVSLAFCICSATMIIPYLNFLTGVAALVLLIIMLVRFNEMKNMIPPRED